MRALGGQPAAPGSYRVHAAAQPDRVAVLLVIPVIMVILPSLTRWNLLTPVSTALHHAETDASYVLSTS